MKTFAERLRLARELRGLTQAQLASACGVAQSTVANYENGLRRSARDPLALASALEVSPHWLIEGVGTMEPSPLREPGPHSPAEAYASARISDWPFLSIAPEIFWSLKPAERELVENTMVALITSIRQTTSDK